MKPYTKMKLEFDAHSENEAFARTVTAGFLMQADPTVEELCEMKTAVSEAVTNAIVHGCRHMENGVITLSGRLWEDGRVMLKIRDKGCGMEDVEKAMEPMYTTRPEEERTGLGFAVMEISVDRLRVWSVPGKGTCVTLIKQLSRKDNLSPEDT